MDIMKKFNAVIRGNLKNDEGSREYSRAFSSKALKKVIKEAAADWNKESFISDVAGFFSGYGGGQYAEGYSAGYVQALKDIKGGKLTDQDVNDFIYVMDKLKAGKRDSTADKNVHR